MSNSSTNKKPIGVIGAGSFGTAMSNLIARNADVLLYTRQEEIVQEINERHTNIGVSLSKRIRATSDYEELASRCHVILPFVPSENFRAMMRDVAPFLHPYHIIIHGTKGFDVRGMKLEEMEKMSFRREDVSTMSEVIRQESVVVRVGCLSGPNLAKEIMEEQPTATVVASVFEEVIDAGKHALKSRKFMVFGNHDILGAELAGALKNIIAIGSGILGGMGFGKNIQAMLLTRGLVEMIYFGKAMGATTGAFFGTAGIGDLIATATSEKSRNYTFGYRLGSGEDFQTIAKTMPELAEGVRTLKIAKKLADSYKLHAPITEMLHRVVFENHDIQRAINHLMRYPYDVDVDFL